MFSISSHQIDRGSGTLRGQQAAYCQASLAKHSCHFGISHTIISDNRNNFANKQVASLCAKYNIAHRFFSPYYPQGSVQAEISNRTILDNLCKILNKVKGKLAEKPPRVLLMRTMK